MSILTSYRPNFCCECGHKIVRLRWFSWTSRRFCDKCFRQFAKAQWLRPTLSLFALLFFGVFIGRGCRRAPPPLIIERPATVQSGNSAVGPSPTNGLAKSSNSTTATASTATATTQPLPATEQVYICGARTKKGTPCSRRVHGPVRCWQHKGAPAMLPQEKLLVKE
jgi:hypothetical protein